MTLSTNLRLGVRVLSTLRNPGTYLAHYRKRITTEKVTYRLRNGLSATLRTRSTDRNVFNDIWLEHVYNQGSLPWESMKTILDIGAHIGMFSLYAAHRAPQATIYAFEPDPANVALLRENMKQNSLSQRMHIDDHAVGDKSGTLRLYIDPLKGEGNSAYRQTENSQPLNVPVVTLREIFATRGIERCDLVKMNCEGGEYDTLYGLPDDLFARIDALLINYHLFSPAEGHNPRDLTAHLETKGYRVGRYASEILLAKRQP